MNIPIYRAKRIDSDEWVEGYLTKDCFGKHFIEKCFQGVDGVSIPSYRVDETTIAIHFVGWREDVFASIEPTGFGGTLFRWNRAGIPSHVTLVCVFSGYKAVICDTKTMGKLDLFIDASELEVIGIHRG